MERKKLIEYIKKHDKFYEAVNFIGHSNEQLFAIKRKIQKEQEDNTCPICSNTRKILNIECFVCKEIQGEL